MAFECFTFKKIIEVVQPNELTVRDAANLTEDVLDRTLEIEKELRRSRHGQLRLTNIPKPSMFSTLSPKADRVSIKLRQRISRRSYSEIPYFRVASSFERTASFGGPPPCHSLCGYVSSH